MRQKPSCVDRLREAMQQDRQRIANLPFFQSLTIEKLPLTVYVGLLRGLSVVYEAFEQTMLHPNHPHLATVWNPSMRKLPLIDRDLAAFQRNDLPQTPVPVLRAHLLAQTIRGRAHDDPLSLLGYLYVLSGPLLGELFSPLQIANAFQLSPSGGLAYVSSYDPPSGTNDATFDQQMNRVLASTAKQDRVWGAAIEALTGIEHLIAGLHPHDDTPRRDLARELNPAAGSHAITTDTHEVEAAFRAGERSWREFPYYKWRYGERGMQFTRSDSAWLVTLASHPQHVVD